MKHNTSRLRKIFRTIIRTLVTIICLIIAGVARYRPSLSSSYRDAPASAMLDDFSPYKQKRYRCAANSIRGALSATDLLPPKSMPTTIRQSYHWKTQRGTIPPIMQQYLSDNDIPYQAVSLIRYNNQWKLKRIRDRIARGHAVVILGGGTLYGGDYQHYVTIVGYDTDHRYIYDSARRASTSNSTYTVDDTPKHPGNRKRSDQTLLQFWGGGGFGWVYGRYALAIG